MTDTSEGSDSKRVAVMPTEVWAPVLIVAIFLLPFLVLALVVFGPINDDILVEHASTLASMIPGLEKSFSNIQQYSSTLNAAKFVTIYFWSFTSDCAIAVVLGLVFGLIRKLHKQESNGNKDHIVVVSATRHPRRMVGPALFVLCFVVVFFFAPLAYIPSPGTSVDKAYQGSTFAAVVMSSFSGVFLFLLSAYSISSVYGAILKLNERG